MGKAKCAVGRRSVDALRGEVTSPCGHVSIAARAGAPCAANTVGVGVDRRDVSEYLAIPASHDFKLQVRSRRTSAQHNHPFGQRQAHRPSPSKTCGSPREECLNGAGTSASWRSHLPGASVRARVITRVQRLPARARAEDGRDRSAVKRHARKLARTFMKDLGIAEGFGRRDCEMSGTRPGVPRPVATP